jgi:hypothetical protein
MDSNQNSETSKYFKINKKVTTHPNVNKTILRTPELIQEKYLFLGRYINIQKTYRPCVIQHIMEYFNKF